MTSSAGGMAGNYRHLSYKACVCAGCLPSNEVARRLYKEQMHRAARSHDRAVVRSEINELER